MTLPPVNQGQGLDLNTIVKASQTLSREVRLETLMANLMNIIMENAGATNGTLIIEEEGTLVIQGKMTARSGKLIPSQKLPVNQSGNIPLSIINYTARTQTSIVLNDVLEDKIYSKDPYIQTHMPISVLCMPIRHLGKLSGILYLENNLTHGAFTEDRVQLLEVLSSQAAISMENAILYDTLEKKVVERTRELKETRDQLWGEMELARKIQTVLIPATPSLPGYDICASLEPAREVGGDYYDVIESGSSHWIVMGDVTGHGVSAGLIMMMVQTALHTIINETTSISPSAVLAAVNRTIYWNIQRLGESKHMTILLLSAGSDGAFSFSGRHDAMMIWRSASETVEIVESTGMWLGITPDIQPFLKDTPLHLDRGDCLILYTDGITEAVDPDTDELFGENRLVEIVRKLGNKTAQEMQDGILGALDGYIKKDDVTLVVVKRP
ncbi:MAG: GAF domain-containing SpoIIE family protein phosphatase [Pseudomonadota bacterium]